MARGEMGEFGPCVGGGSSRDCERGECNALAACTAMGESTSAAFRHAQQALAASQADLTRAEQDRAEAVEKCTELAAELRAANLRLAQAERERDAAMHDGTCGWRGIAVNLMREREGQ
jgi:Na+-translocating ferredoxin:NAD+ oxidoreductase RnfC subunit